MARPNAGQTLDVVRDGASGIHEGLEGVENLVAPEAHRANFEDGVALCVEPRRFQIEGNVDLFQRGNQSVLPTPTGAQRLLGHITPIPLSPLRDRHKV